MTVTTEALWDGLSAAALAASCGVPRVELFTEVDSTLDVAHIIAQNGAPMGTLVVADSQRTGRGRLGRPWSSPSSHGVWCTILERPTDPRALDVLSIRVGLGIAAGLDELAGEQVRLKWPNDLLLRAGKLGGILLETRWSGATLAWAAVGVGLNVIAPAGVPAAAGLPQGVRRSDVLRVIVAAVRDSCTRRDHLTPEEIIGYSARDALVGRRITAPAEGTVVGLDRSGALIVAAPVEGEGGRGGRRELHRAGTVRFAGEEES